MPLAVTDHHWLLSDEAETWLTNVMAETGGQTLLPAYVNRLRRSLGPTRTALVLEQVQLRTRAHTKFSQATRLFFTPKGLEQATDESIARYKAQRFANDAVAYDLCCGIGGDAMGLATRGPIHLIDRDPLALLFAQENVARTGGSATTSDNDVAQLTLPANAAWHIDPDRRAAGGRTTRIELGEPGVEALNRLLVTNPHAAIKLAPATTLPDDWPDQCTAEWIESRGECRQLVAWFGAHAIAPGQRMATRVEASGATSFVGEPHVLAAEVDHPRAYIYDPAPSLLAAHLLGAWCEQQGLEMLAGRSCYLASDDLHCSPLQQAFRVIDILPLDVTQLRAYCRARRFGRLEIKQRGLDITPEKLRPQLHLEGEHEAVLMLAEINHTRRAIFCERVNAPA